MKGMSKGISEIVGVTIIVGLAVVLAVGFIYWGSGAMSGESDEAKGLFGQGITQAYADVDITDVVWYSGNSTIYVEVENTGGIDLSQVNVFAGGKLIKYYDSILTAEVVTTSAVLISKPDKIVVVSAEGAGDEQNV